MNDTHERYANALSNVNATYEITRALHQSIIDWLEQKKAAGVRDDIAQALSNYLHDYTNTVAPLQSALGIINKGNITPDEVHESHNVIFETATEIRTRVIYDRAFNDTGARGYAGQISKLHDIILQHLETMDDANRSNADVALMALEHIPQNAELLAATIDALELAAKTQAPDRRVVSSELHARPIQGTAIS